MIINADRVTLHSWRETDRRAFAMLHADPAVMHDMGGPFSRDKSDTKFDRYASAFAQHGFCRWAIENSRGEFLGYAGLMPSRPAHPLGPHADIGWRLVRSAWGKGHATAAAGAALQDAFARLGFKEVLAYTAADNLRSQAVMQRLGLERAPLLDYSETSDAGTWHGLVWIARPTSTPYCGMPI